MSTTQEIHDQQKQIWNNAAPGWKKWDAFLLKKYEPVTETLLKAAHIAEGQQVLELACGTGEPGIPAAKKVGKGSVIGTDLSEDMMKVAEEKAKALGVTNYHTQKASALKLPFKDAQFDAILCRWGIMFFPEPLLCLKEALRVLKDGAFAAFATWNEGSRNPHASIPLGVAVQKLGFTPPSPDVPGVLRYADPHKLAKEMIISGFKDVMVEEAVGATDFDSPDQYWEYAVDLIGPFRNAWTKAEPALQEQVKQEVMAKVQALVKDGKVHMTYSSWVVSGKRIG